MAEKTKLLEIRDLKKYFTVTLGLMKNKIKELYIKVLEKTKENIKTFYQ